VADRTITTDLIGRDRMSPAYDSAGRSAERNGGIISKAGKMLGGAVAGGAAAGAAALVAFGKSAIDSAANAEQSIGATETVFGDFAETVIATSKKAADAVGLSANDYRENANLIGALFKNQGVSAAKLGTEVNKQIKLGADLAATYGGTTAEAVQVLGAAYKGEFDSLDRFGISLSATTVQAYLASKGQDKLTGSALDAAKQQATQKLIMDQAGAALGAFGRETDTTAHKQQVLKAKYEDLSATLGEKLLPFMNQVLEVGLKMIAWGSKHQDVLAALGAAVGVVTGAILLLNLAMLANPAGLLVIGLAALAAGFVLLWRRSETFRAVMTSVFKTVSNVILSNVSVILGIFARVFDVLGRLPGKAGKAFRSAADSARSAQSKVEGLRASINRLPTRKAVGISVTTTYVTKGTRTAPSEFMAKGGPVTKGRPYVVGDGGRPELFVPDSNGTLLPRVPSEGAGRMWNGAGQSGGNTYLTIYVNEPLGTPSQIGDAIVRAFERRPAGSRRIPASAVSNTR
jgi:hypothetical protein